MTMARCGGMVLSVLVSVGSAWAGTLNWTNTEGGLFSDAVNWEGGVTPGPADSANFTNLGDYTVTLDADTVLSNLLVNADATAGGSHYLAQNAGSFGELTVQGGRLNLTNSSLYCGSAGTGVLNLRGGTGFVSVLYLGNSAGSKGVLTMSEPGAFMSAGLNLGNTAGADSEMYLSNGWFAARGETKFCISGRTLMMLNGGSITQDTGNTYLPHYAGTGVLVMASAESTFYLGGGLAIGQNTVGGQGEIYVTNGTVNTASLSLGGTANSLASLTIYNGTTVVRNTSGTWAMARSSFPTEQRC